MRAARVRPIARGNEAAATETAANEGGTTTRSSFDERVFVWQ